MKKMHTLHTLGTEQKNIIAKKMLAKKIDINLIMEITGLTKEEIESL